MIKIANASLLIAALFAGETFINAALAANLPQLSILSDPAAPGTVVTPTLLSSSNLSTAGPQATTTTSTSSSRSNANSSSSSTQPTVRPPTNDSSASDPQPTNRPTTNSSSAASTQPTNRSPTNGSSASGSQATNNQTIESGDAGNVSLVNPIVIKGNRFFDSVTGEYFAVRGVNYYPRPNTGALDQNNLDFFSDDFQHIWGRDLPQFVALNANTIRLYAVDPEMDHSSFMCALQAEGIYVIVDLGANCKGCEITADSAPTCYPAAYKSRGEKIIKQFARFDNVLAFSGGNEINHRTNGNPWTWNAPCQKKFIRDMRAFLKSCPTMRQVPVGLVVADTSRDDNAQYYNCRTNPADELENAEWYGINTYVHCDDISDPAKATGFNMLRDSFKGYQYSIPVVLTEFGCVTPSFPTVDGYEAQRTFHDAVFMNSRAYSDYFAGGVAFEYSTENANSKDTCAYPFTTYGPQNYGLGYFSPEDCTDTDVKCKYKRFPNFAFLAEAYGSYDNSSEPTLANYKVPADHVKTSTCPKGSPILSKFTWAGDSTKNEECLSKTESRYQCPNVERSAWITDYSLSDDSSLRTDSSLSADSSLSTSGPSSTDNSLFLDSISSGQGSGSDGPESTVKASGVEALYESSFIRNLFLVLVMLASTR